MGGGREDRSRWITRLALAPISAGIRKTASPISPAPAATANGSQCSWIGEEVSAGDVPERGQLARGRDHSVGEEGGDHDRDQGQGPAFEGIQAEHLHGRDSPVPEERHVALAALHEVRYHHGEVVDDRHDHYGQQDGQRHHGEEASLLVVGYEASDAGKQRRSRYGLDHLSIHAFDTVQQVCRAPLLESLLVQEEEPVGRDQRIGERSSRTVDHCLFGYKQGQRRLFRVEVCAVEHHRRQWQRVEEEVSGAVPKLFVDIYRIDDAYYLDKEPARVPDGRSHHDRVTHVEVEDEGRPATNNSFHHEAVRP